MDGSSAVAKGGPGWAVPPPLAKAGCQPAGFSTGRGSLTHSDLVPVYCKYNL